MARQYAAVAAAAAAGVSGITHTHTDKHQQQHISARATHHRGTEAREAAVRALELRRLEKGGLGVVVREREVVAQSLATRLLVRIFCRVIVVFVACGDGAGSGRWWRRVWRSTLVHAGENGYVSSRRERQVGDLLSA